VVLDRPIADEDFSDLTGKANGNGLIFAKLAIIVVELGKSKDVLCNLIHVGFTVLNINAERLRDFRAVVGAEARLES
jgi:hypothetical protein